MAQWWDKWELRILVLASLSAQYFLLLFARTRKFHMPRWLRLLFRLVHIGSDALAIFTLAMLFNRLKSGLGRSYAPGNRQEETIWIPLVLQHFGGHIVITTYKIEDNEQSTRYLLTSLSKVMVATYYLLSSLIDNECINQDWRECVVFTSWSFGGIMLLQGTIGIFIMSIIRCFIKFHGLKSTSFSALRKAYSSWVTIVRGSIMREDEQLFQFVRQAKQVMDCDRPLETVDIPTSLPCRLFLDFPCSYSDRSRILRNFWSLDHESAYCKIEGALSSMTSFLYTKDHKIYSPSNNPPYIAFRKAPTPAANILVQYGFYILVGCGAAIAKTITGTGSRLSTDRVITHLLMFGTGFLEVAYIASDRILRDKFSSRIFQHSLIGLFVHNRRNSRLRSIAEWLQCKDLLDGFWRVEPSNSCKEITELVRQHLQTWWKDYISDTECYKMVNDSRGEWTLASYESCDDRIVQSIRRPFDESIILWHLATDLYIHHTASRSRDEHGSRARQCKEMSNYMVHLLCHNPEMLLPGSRNGLLATAYKELEDLLVGERTLQDENEIAQRVFEKCVLTSSGREDADTASLIRDGANASLIRDGANASLIRDASELARSLLGFADQTKVWDLIQGVWVEMLCFSAGRCRGYLHAEALGTGVEFLSYVWVLLAHAGMETFAEKLLKREGQRGRQNAATQFDSSQSEG